MPKNESPVIPVVMVIAGSDPTGGAGIQADIEAVASMGCHAAPILTAVTIQDTTNLMGYASLDADLIIQQARAVLEDIPVAAIKIGFTGSVGNVEAIHSVLSDYSQIPVVLDPVLHAGGGARLTDEETLAALKTLLLPSAKIVTPNSREAKMLAPQADNLDACAMSLLEQGIEYVLITGTHEDTLQVNNSLYGNHRKLEMFSWERLQGSYHGSGCTLSSAIAGLLAQGQEPFSAIHEAQEYTYQCLKSGYRIGMGQHLPNRLFWASLDDDSG